MSILQEQIIQMISELSDDNVRFLIEVIQRLMPQKTYSPTFDSLDEEEMQAFYRLEKARIEIQQYLPKDFDPDKELKEAKEERYGCID